MELKFENLANINNYSFRYIKRKTNYFLKYVLEDSDYSEFLTRVEIVDNNNEDLKFYFLTGKGGYDYNNKKIVLTDIKNRDGLDLCIHHEVLHLQFAMNNQFVFNNYFEFLGYNFLNEFNSVYGSYMYNLILNPNDEYSINGIKNEISMYEKIYRLLKKGLRDFQDNIGYRKLEESQQQLVNEHKNSYIITNNYLLARSIACIYINLKLANKWSVGNEFIDKIILYIKENINFKNITSNNCEEIGKIVLELV